jgi:hypothetical protein
MEGITMTKPTPWLIRLLFVLCLPAGSALAQTANDPSSPAVWREQAYGMSLTPPPGSLMFEQTDDGARVKFRSAGNATFSIYIRQANSALDLDTVKQKALQEFAFLYPSALPTEQDREPVSIAGREGIGLYLLTPDPKQGDWVFAQAFMLIDPTTLAIFQLDCDAVGFDLANTTFKNMLKSVQLTDPAELDRARSDRLERAQAWLDSIDSAQAKSAIVPEQWLRIVRGDKDVGYLRVKRFDEKDHVPPGNSVHVQSHIIEGNNTYDTEGSYFEADDRSVEFWTITTTLRVANTATHDPQAPLQPKVENWRQTGLRDGNRIEVSQETPSSIKKFPWTKPTAAYLSQVDLFNLPALLPRDKPVELAFYAFNPIARKISLRTLRIEPMPGGGYRVHDRPTPDRAEQIATYDHNGRLLKRKMPDGRTYLTTTPQELKRIWGAL